MSYLSPSDVASLGGHSYHSTTSPNSTHATSMSTTSSVRSLSPGDLFDHSSSVKHENDDDDEGDDVPEITTCQWDGCSATYDDPETMYQHLCNEHVGRKSTNNLCLTCKWTGCSE